MASREHTPDPMVSALRRMVRVKAPLPLLRGPDLALFLERGYAPEVCVGTRTLDRLGPEDLRPLAEALRDHGLKPTMHGPFMGLDPGSRYEPERGAAREYMERTLRLAEVLEPERVVFHGGGLFPETRAERERWAEASLPLWEWLSESLADLGSGLALENVLDYEPEPLHFLLENLPEAGWCFDLGHQRLFDRVGLEHWLAVLGPRLTHLHLHDNHGRDDDHLPLGKGDLDLARVLGLLAALPEPTATLEVEHRRGVEASLPVLAEFWPWPGGPNSRD